MQISSLWLADFIDWHETDPQIIADRLTASTGEVDEIDAQGGLLDNCVIGKIISIAKHPNADKLSLCDVETDRGMKRVVCGGTNLKLAQLVAFAHIGATVKWHGGERMTLQPVKIRGEASEGMICAAEELNLDAMYPPAPEDGERPVVDLTVLQLPAGTSLQEALRLNDVLFHIDNHAITNRPDLFSHIGVARECVALGLASWKKKSAAKKLVFAKNPLPFRCVNDAPDLVRRYESCLLQIDEVGQTPDWMKRRLEATGSRSINLPIDITNYVMMETGMPLHSFDADDFSGDIRMRTATKGESITTLDGVERALPDGAVVISDDAGIFDLLGIMGGLRSSTKDTTKRIYLHSAQVDGTAIRKTIVATGHRTDAATIYEKGVAAVTVEQGFVRALELMLELVPGAKIISKRESWGENPKPKPITVSMNRLTSMLGQDIPEKMVTDILSNLEFDVKKQKGTGKVRSKSLPLTAYGLSLSVTPPPFRADVTGEHDVMEEVARIYGYAAITPTMPVADVHTPAIDDRIHVLRGALKECGYVEQLHLAFVSPALLKGCGLDPQEAVRLDNPLGEELSLMRTSLLPHMLKTAGREVRREGHSLKLFEYGHVFRKGTESMELCLVISAKERPKLIDEPLLKLKNDLHYALKALGYAPTFSKKIDGLPAFAHPSRTAEVKIDGTVIGLLCEIHPSLESADDLSNRTAVALIDWPLVLSLPQSVRVFKPLPAFPAITYDETLPLPFKTDFNQVVTQTQSIDPLLHSIETIDLYDDKDAQSITLRFTYRSNERTLTQEEIDAAHKKLMEKLRIKS